MWGFRSIVVQVFAKALARGPQTRVTYLVYLMFTRMGPFVARSCVRHDSPHQKDRHGTGQRGDADGARHRAVVIDALGHDVD